MYQLGRGREPVIVVGSILLRLALNIKAGDSSGERSHQIIWGRFRLYGSAAVLVKRGGETASLAQLSLELILQYCEMHYNVVHEGGSI